MTCWFLGIDVVVGAIVLLMLMLMIFVNDDGDVATVLRKCSRGFLPLTTVQVSPTAPEKKLRSTLLGFNLKALWHPLKSCYNDKETRETL